MSAPIAVNCAYLNNLADSSRGLADLLNRFLDLPASGLESAPVVDQAYHDMSYNWDERREELASGLCAVADLFVSVASSFEQTDSELASGISGEGGAS